MGSYTTQEWLDTFGGLPGPDEHSVIPDLDALRERAEEDEREAANARFVIAAEEGDGCTLFWSNSDGWGALSTATVFTAHERENLSLPIGDGARWVVLER